MLLSHKYKFIFIKTLKTAGTSIEVDLSKIMGPGDIVTPVYPAVEGHCPRNYRIWNPIRHLRREIYYNHVPARTVRKLAGRRVFDSYFKFCVEREPVAKCISLFTMKTKDPGFDNYQPDLTWDEFVEQGRFPYDNQTYVDADGTLLVDRILRYEHLNEDMAQVAQELGFAFNRLETKAKGGLQVRSPVDVTPAQRQRIYDAFSRTLPFTGYTL